jgi:hypothetical protein
VTSTARVALVMLAVATLVLGGCGEHGRRSAGSRPAFPRPLAQQFAAESDDVAHQLAAGASCAALSVAMRLERQAVQAIDAGRVPAAFRPALRSTTADLASRIHCVAPTPTPPRARPAPPPEKHGHGKQKGHGKHKGNDKGEGD